MLPQVAISWNRDRKRERERANHGLQEAALGVAASGVRRDDGVVSPWLGAAGPAWHAKRVEEAVLWASRKVATPGEEERGGCTGVDRRRRSHRAGEEEPWRDGTALLRGGADAAIGRQRALATLVRRSGVLWTTPRPAEGTGGALGGAPASALS
jgi:hypothetical protein